MPNKLVKIALCSLLICNCTLLWCLNAPCWLVLVHLNPYMSSVEWCGLFSEFLFKLSSCLTKCLHAIQRRIAVLLFLFHGAITQTSMCRGCSEKSKGRGLLNQTSVHKAILDYNWALPLGSPSWWVCARKQGKLKGKKNLCYLPWNKPYVHWAPLE